jgi:hypothetical protein
VREPLLDESDQVNARCRVSETREIPRWVARNNEDFVESGNRLFNVARFGQAKIYCPEMWDHPSKIPLGNSASLPTPERHPQNVGNVGNLQRGKFCLNSEALIFQELRTPWH